MLVRRLIAVFTLLAFALVPFTANASMLPAIKLPKQLICDDLGRCSTKETQNGNNGDGTKTRPIGNTEKPKRKNKGPTKCENTHGTEIPCSDKERGVWNSGDECYWKLSDRQKAPPPGKDPSKGAWYECSPAPKDCSHIDKDDWVALNICEQSASFYSPRMEWRDSPPPGVDQLTPRQAAKRFIDTFQLEGVDFTSTIAQKDSGAVNLPVWLWVPDENQKPLNWGPYKRSKTLGGVAITADAKVTNVKYSMGDGGSVSCNGAGQPWIEGSGRTDSPSCGYRYSKMSPGDGSRPYEITARATWKVTWTGGGESGTVTTFTESTGNGYVGELHVLNSRD